MTAYEDELAANGWRLWENQQPPLNEEVEWYRHGFSEGGRITRAHTEPIWNVYNVWWRSVPDSQGHVTVSP